MVRGLIAACLLLTASTATAADTELQWQARLLDTTGTPISGSQNVTVTLYDDATPVWRKTYLGTDVDDGYLSLLLSGDDDTTRPLDTSLFASDLLVGVAVGDEDELGVRMSVGSVPRAASVIGHVQPSANGADCGPSLVGTLRWQSGALEVCNEADRWVSLYDDRIEVLGIGPQTGAAGTTVTISGENFTTGQMVMTLDGIAVPLLSQSQSELTFAAPMTPLDEVMPITLTNSNTGSTSVIDTGWTRTVAVQEFLISGTNASWTVPWPGTIITATVVGGGGSGGRSHRTGGSVDSYGGGGGGGGLVLLDAFRTPDNIATATYTIGQGAPPNNPNNSGGSNQCLRSPSGDGVSTDGRAGTATQLAFGPELVLTAGGGGGGLGGVIGNGGDGGDGGIGEVSGPLAGTATTATANGGDGSGLDSGRGLDGLTTVLGGVTHRAPGGGGAGASNSATGSNDGGNGASVSFTGGAGGGGADNPTGSSSAGSGGSGLHLGGNGESNTSGAGFTGGGATYSGVALSGGAGGQTGIGRQVSGDPETGRRNAGGGGALFGAGGGGGGDSCSAGSGGGAQGVVVLTY